jgi:hypothetical protein
MLRDAIQLIYKIYYAEMGGAVTAPEIPSRSVDGAADTGNVTAFRRPPAKPKVAVAGPTAKPRLPVALIFACLVVVYVGIRYSCRSRRPATSRHSLPSRVNGRPRRIRPNLRSVSSFP